MHTVQKANNSAVAKNTKVALYLIGFLVSSLFGITQCFAQPGKPGQITSGTLKEGVNKPDVLKQTELAQEYVNREDYDKAAAVLDKLAKNEDNYDIIYTTYTDCLLKSKQNAKALDFLKKVTKAKPTTVQYGIRVATFQKLTLADTNAANKTVDKLISNARKNQQATINLGQGFLENNQGPWAAKAYKAGRDYFKDPNLYTLEMAQVYKAGNQTPELFNEVLLILDRDPNSIFYVQQVLQSNLTNKADYKLLRKMLLLRLEAQPLLMQYPEMIYWVALQEKDFTTAIVQAKALDRRLKTEGAKSMEIGYVAMANKDYEAAADAFGFVTTEYPNRPVALQAAKLSINAKEAMLKNTFPVDKAQVQAVIVAYSHLNKAYPSKIQALENQRSMALLYSGYSNNLDSAEVLLKDIIETPRADRQLVDRSKVDLADIYILKQTYWESALLYSQVEKSQKETVLGHEAKLRNARLSYYRADFDLAKDHLDVLKLATTREIANDALDLALLIQDNLDVDTGHTALAEYAAIDLLLTQHKEAEALPRLDALAAKYPNTMLQDEIIWLKAKIFKSTHNWEGAIACYAKIDSINKESIYADDALFYQAELQEEKLADKDKAMALYQRLMTDYPGSVFVAEARKRFRKLRGDAVN